MKLAAIESGGDWADASVDYVSIPDDMDLAAMERNYWTWYRSAYSPALKAAGGNPGKSAVPFQTFAEWLTTQGAEWAGEQVAVFRHD